MIVSCHQQRSLLGNESYSCVQQYYQGKGTVGWTISCVSKKMTVHQLLCTVQLGKARAQRWIALINALAQGKNKYCVSNVIIQEMEQREMVEAISSIWSVIPLCQQHYSSSMFLHIVFIFIPHTPFPLKLAMENWGIHIKWGNWCPQCLNAPLHLDFTSISPAMQPTATSLTLLQLLLK